MTVVRAYIGENETQYIAHFNNERMVIVGGIYLSMRATDGGVSQTLYLTPDPGNFYPYPAKSADLGATYAWDDAYADDFHNVADVPFLDDHDDLAVIAAIRKGGRVNPRTGLPLIDDDTLPDWLLSKGQEGFRQDFAGR